MRRSTRIILIMWACLLLFGLAVEGAKASALDGGGSPNCAANCTEQCSNDGGCAYFRAAGCRCYFICDNGTRGRTVCG